jgi:hypothetical protein
MDGCTADLRLVETSVQSLTAAVEELRMAVVE